MSTAGTDPNRPAASVVVGVDDSTQSHAALRWAVAHAERVGVRVRAVAVWSPPPAAGGSTAGAIMATDAAMDDEALGASARQRLDRAMAELPPSAAGVVDHLVVCGEAASALLDAAQDAELLILGNAGRGALAAAVLGSIAMRCVHHARCPVVLVPEHLAGPS